MGLKNFESSPSYKVTPYMMLFNRIHYKDKFERIVFNIEKSCGISKRKNSMHDFNEEPASQRVSYDLGLKLLYKRVTQADRSYISKEDTSSSRLKNANAGRSPNKCLSFGDIISFCCRGFEKIYPKACRGVENMYTIAVVQVCPSIFMVHVTPPRFMEFNGIPEHCMRNKLRPQMEIIASKSHSPFKFAGGRFDQFGILVQSEKIDVESERGCLLLRNGHGPGIYIQKIISINVNIDNHQARRVTIVENMFRTTDFRVHNSEEKSKCISEFKKHLTHSKSIQRQYALCEKDDVSSNVFQHQNDGIVPPQSSDNNKTGQVDQEMDMELSKHLCADSPSEAGKVLFDKDNDEKSRHVSCYENDITPSLLKGFYITELKRLKFQPAPVSIWVCPLLNARKRAYFKQVVCYEIVRLWTFYPCESPAHDGSWITELAGAGFYHSGEQGEVSCFSCSRWYKNFLAGIPLQNAHEPRCRWRETNKPLHCGTEGIKSAVFIDFVKTFENSAEWRRMSRSHNVSSSSIDYSGTGLTSLVPDYSRHTSIVPDSGHHLSSSRDGHDGLPSSNHTSEDTSTSHKSGSHDSGQNMVQEVSSDSSILILTSATDEPRELHSGHATGFQRSGIGEVQSDSVVSTETRSNWDLSGASYPQFASREARFESFRHWDPDHIQKPKDLIDLGFFYSGYSDCARCFYCGLGLKYWRPNDDPAYQHARFRPQCLYNKLLKGQEFIDRVQQEISQGPTPSANAARGDSKTRFDRSSAVTQAKEEGWTQEYLDDAYRKLRDSHSDAGDPLYARLLSILQEVQRERQGASALPDRYAGALGAVGHDGVGEERPQPLDDSRRIRLVEMEHARLKDRMHCMFCKVARIGCVFLPCGHVVACQDCGDKATVCILCGKHIAALANIYLS